jgi:hypothetical protein
MGELQLGLRLTPLLLFQTAPLHLDAGGSGKHRTLAAFFIRCSRRGSSARVTGARVLDC